jgi:vacuolar iron transporter family protein
MSLWVEFTEFRPESEVSPLPQTPHSEHHFTGTEVIRDIVIGMADGLTVPFALAAGLTGAVSATDTGIIVTAGLAEIAAGSIAMGLGGYLAARSDAEHYENERNREQTEIVLVPEIELAEVAEVFESYGLTGEEIAPILRSFKSRPEAWIDFMMRFELGLEAPNPKRALTSALTIAGAYIVGGFIPLGPYFVFARTQPALVCSILVTLAALLIFGYVKGRFTGLKPIRSALHTALIGALAAAAAFGIARVFS